MESTTLDLPEGATSTPAAQASSPLFVGWTAEEVDLIRRTIAPDATEHELALYLRLCRTYGLDPFRRELVLEKRRRRRADGTGYDVVPVWITTRDGYLKAAMRDPGYGGICSGVVCEGDTFEIDAEHFRVVHRFGVRRGKILGAWAVAYHKERPPMVGYVPFDEYNDPNSDTWRRHPTAMIQKVAEVFVLRRQFNITAIVAREEMERDLAEEGARRAARGRTTARSSRPAALPASAPRNGGAGNPAPAAAEPAPAPAAPARPTPTEFWTAVRKAAATEEADPMEWLRARTGGEIDLRRLDDRTVIAAYTEARRLLNGERARPTAGEPQAADPAAVPDTGAAAGGAPEPQTPHEPAPAAGAAMQHKRDRIARVQALWKKRGVGVRAQAAMVQAISGKRTAMVGELTEDELDRLIATLEAQE
jgi:phage recombination protein Bet